MDLLISVRSQYARKIADGEKTWEFRKRPCREEVENVVVYSTKPDSAIVAIAPLKEVKILTVRGMWNQNKAKGNPGCISHDDFQWYYAREPEKSLVVALVLGDAEKLHIPLAQILEVKPNFHPPQSYVYLQEGSAIAKLIAQHREGLRCF